MDPVFWVLFFSEALGPIPNWILFRFPEVLGKGRYPFHFTKTNLCLMVTRPELRGTTSFTIWKKEAPFSMIPSIIQDRKFSCFL